MEHGHNSCWPAHRYALVTAAYNEASFIGKTIESVVAQQVPPVKWVIVSDGSTDGTDELVARYVARVPYIEFIRRERDHNRGFASKVTALQAGVRLLDFRTCDLIGHLDGDVSFAPSYFRDLLDRFKDPGLGIGGGYVCERRNGRFLPRRNNRPHSVAGAVQLFRRECYEEVGGLKPLVYGGEDWHAEITARMNRWKVQSFPDLQVFHHRSGGAAEGRLRSWYRQGLMDYFVGSHPVFEVAKMCTRLPNQPPVVGALVRLASFTLASIRRPDRPVSPEFIKFLRAEQSARLLQFRGSPRPES